MEISMVRITTMGEARISLREVNLQPGSGLSFSVVLYLALEAGQYVTRTKMRAMFWPGVPEGVARHALRQCVYTIRNGGGIVSCDRDRVLVATHTVTVDYHALAPDPTADPSVLLRDFLPDYEPRISTAHDNWLQSLRDRTHAHLRRILLAAIAQYRCLARWTDVEAAARRCLELDPLNEEATLALAEAMAMAGRKLAAMQILDTYREELGPDATPLSLPVDTVRHRVTELLSLMPPPKDIPFVGRASQLAILGAQSAQLRLSRGGSYHVWGPRGIGKSRLIAEVSRLAILDGVKVINVACSQHTPTTADEPFRKLVSELLRLPGAIGCSPSALSALRTLVDQSPDRYRKGARITSIHAFQAITDALIDLADAVSQEQPLLIILDDIDGTNGLSEYSLARLRGAAHDRPVLVLSSSRAPLAEPALSGRNTHSLEVDSLSDAESTTLLNALTAKCASGMREPFHGRCIAVAGGNPALLIDIALQWCASGTAFQFPLSVINAFNDRFSHLDENAQRLLQLCVVFGTECTVERVLRTGLYDSTQVARAIEQLGRSGLVAFHDGSIVVADPFVSTHFLAKLSEAAVRYLNHVAALSLEAELRLPQYQVLVWQCARHHRRAGNSARAVELLTACADHALRQAQLTEGIAILQRAKDLCTTAQERLLVTERLVRPLRLAERWRQAWQTIQFNSQQRRDLRSESNGHDDLELTSLAARWQLNQPLITLIKDINRCLVDEKSSPQHRADAAVQLLILAHNMGDSAGMRFAYAIASDIKTLAGDSVSILTAEMIYHSAIGELSTAAAVAEKLVDVARSCLSAPELALTLRQVALPLRFVGRFDTARQLLDEALSITTALGANYASLKAADMIGTTFLEQGQLTQAWEWYMKSVRWSGGAGDPTWAAYARNLGAKVALLQSKTSTAARLVRPRARKALKRSVLRLRCDELAIWITLSLQKGVTHFDAKLISALEDAFATLKHLGSQDFTAYALTLLRRTTKGTDSAASLLSDYLANHRREISSPPAYLRDLVDSLRKN
jgi:DNA-binding SARP family transcriptional activator/tetratricopeptide (TPR) repeat protein